MDLMLETDEHGRIICTIVDGRQAATVTASNMPDAASELPKALERARASGLGECWWEEQGGAYRCLFRRDGDRVTVVVLWSTGTITGWEHVFRSECDLAWLATRITEELASLARPS